MGETDIPLQKLNKFHEFLLTCCHEGGAVPGVTTLPSQYLPLIFEKHLERLKEKFSNKPVAIIVDETTDSQTCSIVNTLFCYHSSTKLVSINFVQLVNRTVGSSDFGRMVYFF